MSSASNAMSAMIRSSASISTTLRNSTWNASGPHGRVRASGTSEDEAPAAGRYDGLTSTVRDPDVGDCPHVRDDVHPDRVGCRRSRPDGDRRCENVVGQHAPPSRPSHGPRSALRTRSYTWLAAFSSRGACGCSSSKRASAASRSASSNSSNRQTRSPSNVKRATSRHSASKPSCEVPVDYRCDDHSKVAQPMHSLDVTLDVRGDVLRSTDVWGHVAGRERSTPPMIDVHPVRRRRGDFVPVVRGVACVITDHVCAWAAASPARYRASNSAKAASRSSESNTTRATIWFSASISETHSTLDPDRRQRRSKNRGRGARPRVAMTVDVKCATPTSATARWLAISASRPCLTPAFTTRRRSSMEMSSASISA